MHHPITLAAYGLDAPGWEDTFFPDDLPADWRLAYYANEYPVILLSPEVWAQPPDVREWLEEVHGGFAYHFMVSADMPEQDLEALIEAASVLGPRLKGLLIRADDAAGYAALLDRLSGVTGGRSLAVMSPYQQYPLCWQADTPAGTHCGPGLLQLQGVLSPRELRAILERYTELTDSDAPVLFVHASYPVFETLKSLLELMGL